MKQPKVLKVAAFAQMCKFFGHYGAKTLMVLYMVKTLHYSDSRAFGVNALLSGLAEMGAIFGGILADRYLGFRKSLLAGGVLLAAGYGCFLFEKSILTALAMVIMGSTLFSSNIAAVLGAAYQDERRYRGFTIFYMMQNLGALLGVILCSLIVSNFGFKYGFLTASGGMAAGMLALFWNRNLIPEGEGNLAWIRSLILIPVGIVCLGISYIVLQRDNLLLKFLPWITTAVFCFFAIKLLNNKGLNSILVRKLMVYLGSTILYFAIQDQMCSSLIIFSEREVDRTFLGWTVPSSMIMSFNPIIVFACGILISRARFPLFIPFSFIAVSFGTLSLLCLNHIPISMLGMVSLVMGVSVAELMVGPLAGGIASEVSQKGSQGMVMGMVPIAHALGFLLGGSFSKMVAIEDSASSLATYGQGFGNIALISLGGGIMLNLLLKFWPREKKIRTS